MSKHAAGVIDVTVYGLERVDKERPMFRVTEMFLSIMGKQSLFQSLYKKFSPRNEHSGVYSKVFICWVFGFSLCGIINLEKCVCAYNWGSSLFVVPCSEIYHIILVHHHFFPSSFLFLFLFLSSFLLLLQIISFKKKIILVTLNLHF